MKNPKLIRAAILTILATSLGACATSQPKFAYAPGTDVNSEVQSMETRFQTAMAEDVPVLSPKHFDQAQNAFTDAKNMKAKGKDAEDVLEKLGYARGHLDAAVASSEQSRTKARDVVQLRHDAIASHAPEYFEKDFRAADNQFRSYAERWERGKDGMDPADRAELQKMYLDLELRAIKQNELGSASRLIQSARKMNAEKFSPQTLTEAENRFTAAERVIEANRHDQSLIRPAVLEATLAARKAHDITEIARNSQGRSPEQIALEIQSRSEQIEKQRNEMARDASKISARDNAIAVLASSNEKLSARSRLDRSLERARKVFNPEEAEVYRQGDRLIIRLKQIQFPSGRSELPESSFTTLSKTKEVIALLGAEDVKVEGHTDSVGGKALNQKLSQGRAEAVAQYLVAEAAVSPDQVESQGFGYERPLTSNKTKEGRAQNRRVDLVITPTGAKTSDIAE